MKVMVTGGARSGKSSFAERWIMKHAEAALYIATGQAFDEEMTERIALHRQQREQSGFTWTTLEEPLRLAEKLTALGDELRAGGAEAAGMDRQGTEKAGSSAAAVVLVDCLTLWLSNMLLEQGERSDAAEVMEREIGRLAAAAEAFPGTLVMVTNEVGNGIVPEYPLGRLYRDLAGRLNRRMAAISGQVFLVTAGIPIELKSREYRL
ncbi:MAG: bifunctional adenosylcobinamide kinase/adenosylcobinamide-phosphate guanylyltransferase [Paenibacillus macerans]|uniref:Adenosylcobinamide kinase n=1 Tax=Paenibacillus macerans TaxID=44252 RepID=A0A090ZVI1_PAEMA|nr:bifunctional adenosylcobinamide kinase/adenosylcobinamide-phosphate guanylyltransferase [Paenibacillus macerans]KFN08111.1 bifunctional adenosylcobalamin biosynthesis protein CobP [Paenibacillus macerans]MBS5909781.1 bifunctional adenosylcobinamide kinase/adenosylcobinamide-phosphate guanylyltransferase [Paenibacillus macerans]MCY7556778.1 bifunctional adenosylcobinamide kinase/adenosylcobinamide-phosphate guanylyltransferase [Paenibacillus macerans]MDU5948968.1 bifunctional adenosylcobinami